MPFALAPVIVSIIANSPTLLPQPSSLPREIPQLLGLYSNDATPDLSTLDTIPSLVDGILTQSTSPPIDIGNGNINWNLGADFGFTRSVSKIYVYTDRTLRQRCALAGIQIIGQYRVESGGVGNFAIQCWLQSLRN